MPKVTLNGQVLAQSDNIVQLEGNQYFPPDSITQGTLSPSSTTYVCPWKGSAVYYNATVGGTTVSDIAWAYPEPKEAAKRIAGHLAFDKGKVQFE